MVIGLSDWIMGKPMAKNLCKAGYSLIVNDHHIENINELEKCGAESGTLEYIAKNSDVVITMLPNSPQVKEVILGENGVARYMKSGTCFIDMSSINPVDSRYIGKILKEKEIEMLDAPVSGGEPKAIDGTVAFMVGGDENTFEKYKEIFKYFIENKQMVLNIYNCEAQNYLIHFILRQSKPIIEKVIDEKSKNTNIKEEDKDFLCLFYSGALGALIINWIELGMHDDIDTLVKKVKILLDGNISNYVNMTKYSKCQK